jgi:hypothetical protein
MSDSQCIRGGRFKRFKVERGCLGGNGFWRKWFLEEMVLEEMVFGAPEWGKGLV